MYARNTSVSADRSRAEMQKTLQRYGAIAFAYAEKAEAAMVEFQMAGKRVRFLLPMPRKDDDKYTHNRHGRLRWQEHALRDWEQSTRQKWRALALVVKAKLEAVESQITTFEEEFLAHIVLPNGRTAGEIALPLINEAYATGKVPAIGWDGGR